MATTTTDPLHGTVGTATNLNHVYCCDPDTSLCGIDISGEEIVDYDEADCVVCLDLEDQTCPICGE